MLDERLSDRFWGFFSNFLILSIIQLLFCELLVTPADKLQLHSLCLQLNLELVLLWKSAENFHSNQFVLRADWRGS